jgi:hypothetical protein
MPMVNSPYRASFHEKCPKYHEHKGKLGVTPETYGDVGAKTKMIFM